MCASTLSGFVWVCLGVLWVSLGVSGCVWVCLGLSVSVCVSLGVSGFVPLFLYFVLEGWLKIEEELLTGFLPQAPYSNSRFLPGLGGVFPGSCVFDLSRNRGREFCVFDPVWWVCEIIGLY